MADKKISQLTSAALPLTGTETLPVVQSGSTVKVSNNDLRPKQIQSNSTTGVLQVTGPAAASTRVMTTPDANFTAARTDAAQTFSGLQTFSTGIQTGNGSALAPNATMVTVYTFPNVAEVRLYVVLGHTGPVNDAVNFGKFAFVITDGPSATMYSKAGGAASDIQLSGLNLQVAQAAGGTRDVFGTVTRIA